VRASQLIALTAAISGCGFRVAAGEGPIDGPVGGNDGGSDGVADGAAVDAACAAPILIDDVFENADLATAGPQSMGGGFTAVTNAGGGNGSTVEASGLVIRTSTQDSGTPAHGAASNTSFAFNPSGMTVRIVVTAADTPSWNGIAVALQSNKANVDNSGGALMLRVRGQATNSFRVDVGTQNTYDPSLGLQPYDAAELADGFEITWVLRDTSWDYVARGLLQNDAPITDSGGYATGASPADLVDTTAFLGVHIQGSSNDLNPRVLRVGRLTLWNGVCP